MQPELAYPSGMGYCDPGASCSCDPAGPCSCGAGGGYWPGDYWVGSGQGGAVPVWSAWSNRLWVRGEYLLWWTQGADLPPLVTTAPQGDDAVLGDPGTDILFGDSSVNSDTRSGGRISFGYWFSPCQTFGVQASYLALAEETTRFHAESDGDPTLARPFFNVVNAAQDARRVGFDEEVQGVMEDFIDGSVDVEMTTTFQQVDVLFRRALHPRCEGRMDFLIGYEFASLKDDLWIEEATESTAARQQIVPLGTTVDLFERFDVTNKFHGAALGVVFEERLCRWSLEFLMKLGLGNTRSIAFINGHTITEVPGANPVRTPGGLLALPTNMGTYERNHFTMIPELGLTLGYDISCHLKATLGYTFIYWSQVARAGDQIDLDLNETQFSGGNLVGEPRPEFSWKTTDFWAQGLNFGLEYRF